MITFILFSSISALSFFATYKIIKEIHREKKQKTLKNLLPMDLKKMDIDINNVDISFVGECIPTPTVTISNDHVLEYISSEERGQLSITEPRIQQIRSIWWNQQLEDRPNIEFRLRKNTPYIIGIYSKNACIRLSNLNLEFLKIKAMKGSYLVLEDVNLNRGNIINKDGETYFLGVHMVHQVSNLKVLEKKKQKQLLKRKQKEKSRTFTNNL